MANRTLSIVAKVRDAASAGLNKIQKSLKDTGAAAKATSINFTEFNRVMFTTGAFVKFFTSSFANFGNTLMEGARLDRLSTQFERVMGPKGQLFSAIRSFTDNSIDKMEALHAGIAISSLGIAKNTSQVAELIARAGTAAKLAGKESGEGIKQFTQFLKDGSVSHLEFLNLIRSGSPALKLQMSLISKMGGVLGGAMTAQMKYNMGLRLLRAATAGAMKGQRDLLDIVFDLKQSFVMLRNEIGIFLGTALASLLDKLTVTVDKMSAVLEDIRHNKKEILFLAKAFIVATSAMAAFIATAGTLRLVAIGLKAVGIGISPLIFGTAALITLFIGLTERAKKVNEETGKALKPWERFIERLRVFGAIFKGVFQLVSSFLGSADNMSKGIGQIDQDLYEFLNKHKLFGFVHRVSQVTAIVIKFVKDMAIQIMDWIKMIDKTFGKFGDSMLSFFGFDKELTVDLEATGGKIDEPFVKRMNRMLVDSSSKMRQNIIKGASALLVAFAGYKMVKGVLTKLPVIGRLFGGKTDSKRPAGNKNDPLYVRVDDPVKKADAAITILSRLKDMKFSGLLRPFISLFGTLKNFIVRHSILKTAIPAFKQLSGILKKLGSASGSSLKRIATPVLNFGGNILTKVSSVFKDVFGLIKWELGDLAKSIGTRLSFFFRPIKNKLSNLISPVTEVFKRAGTGTKSFFGGMKAKATDLVFGKKVVPKLTGIDKALGGPSFTSNIRAGGIINAIKNVFKNRQLLMVFEGISAAGMRVSALFKILTTSPIARFAAHLYLAAAAFGALKGTIEGVMENFSSFTGLFGAAYDYLRSVDYGALFQDLYNNVAAGFEAATQWISSGLDTAVEAIKGGFDWVTDLGATMYKQLSNILAPLKPAIDWALQPIKKLGEGLAWAANQFIAFGNWLYSKLPDFAKELLGATGQALFSPGETFENFMKAAIGAGGAIAEMGTKSLQEMSAQNLMDQSAYRGGKQLAFDPGSSDERAMYASQALALAQGAEREKMKAALMAAEDEKSAQGKSITREEFAAIFGFALNNSKIAKASQTTANNTKPKAQAMSGKRGGC